MEWCQPLVLLALVTLAGCQETCLSANEDPYLHFGTNSAYTFVARPANYNNRAHEVLGCQPVAFWLVSCHGSHIPEADELPGLQRLQDLKENILANYRNGNFRNTNQKICQADLNLLERWQWNPRHNSSFAGDLTSDGYISTQQLAQAWKQRYPEILTDNRHDYLFKYAEDSRSTTSFRAFTEGLFRAQAEGYGIPKHNDERIVNANKYCPAWSKEVGDNNDTLTQLHIFESKQEFKEMITNISLRLGFNYDIDRSTVYDIYKMCSYNKAWDVVQISPWCSAFTKEDLLKLEYAQDLETYYKYGYGTEANQKVGCTLVKDMLDFFRKHVESGDVPQQPRAQILFTDASTLLMTMASLGTHRSSAPLTGDNFRLPPAQTRRWYSSVMAPFNANVAAVLYKCNRSNYAQDPYQVLFLENEQQMYLEGCRVGLCEWANVKQKYAHVVKECDGTYCSAGYKIRAISWSLVIIGVFMLLA